MKVFQNKEKFNILKWLDVIFLSCIINMNLLRFIFNIYDTSIILYGIYFLYIILSLYKNIKLQKTLSFHKNSTQLNLLLTVILIIVSICSAFIYGRQAVSSSIKFFIAIIIAVMAYYMSLNEIKLTIKTTIIFNIAYCFIIVLSPQTAFNYMEQGGLGTNYLTMTLTIGLTSTIALIYCFYGLFYSTDIRKWLLFFAITILSFFAMMKFAARGPIVLPILSACLIFILMAKNNKSKFILAFVIIIIFGIFAFQIFRLYADSYLIKRLLSLFSNIGGEERITVWLEYLNLIKDKSFYIFGGGTGSAEYYTGYYPHNIYLQLLGEFGLLGIIIAIIFSSKVLISIRNCNNQIGQIYDGNCNKEQKNVRCLFYIVLGGFLYYLLTFMKSFTLFFNLTL